MQSEKIKQLKIEKVIPSENVICLDLTHKWHFREVPNALIAGNVGTGKSVLLIAMIGQLVSQKYDVTIVDAKDVYLSRLKQVSQLSAKVFSEFTGTVDAISGFYDLMIRTRDKHLNSIPEAHFLVIDELGYFVQLGDKLGFADEQRLLYEQAMSQLKEISVMGRELGFYLIISTVLPNAEFLPLVLRNQLTLRIVMGQPSSILTGIMFDNSSLNLLRPLSITNNGLGFVKNVYGYSGVSPFIAPEITSEFDLVQYVENSIRLSEGK